MTHGAGGSSGWGRGETPHPHTAFHVKPTALSVMPTFPGEFLRSCCLSSPGPPPHKIPSGRNCPCPCFRTPGVRLLREMPQEDLHAALKNCFAVLNSSVSEGMSAAILEVITQPGSWRWDQGAHPSCSHL